MTWPRGLLRGGEERIREQSQESSRSSICDTATQPMLQFSLPCSLQPYQYQYQQLAAVVLYYWYSQLSSAQLTSLTSSHLPSQQQTTFALPLPVLPAVISVLSRLSTVLHAATLTDSRRASCIVASDYTRTVSQSCRQFPHPFLLPSSLPRRLDVNTRSSFPSVGWFC